MNANRTLGVGLIGHGGMGRNWLRHLAANPHYQIKAVCEVDPARRQEARATAPEARLLAEPHEIFADGSIDAVAICTRADVRPALMRQGLAARKHMMVEKPLAQTIPEEEALLAEIEKSGLVVAVNLFNRNAWYHEAALAFIASGEIGKLAAIRIRHQTPGTTPGDRAHRPEGPPFHDCGEHYVDVARWYAKAEYQQWSAQGMALWGHPEPWWVSVHGTFTNGVVFQITQGFCYGQLAKDFTISCGLEAIGTLGAVHFRHNFETVELRMHGVNRTEHRDGPYGDKKIDVMVEKVARAILTGEYTGYPTARDAYVASKVSQQMTDDAIRGLLPMHGTTEDMDRIQAYRANRTHYGKGTQYTPT